MRLELKFTHIIGGKKYKIKIKDISFFGYLPLIKIKYIDEETNKKYHYFDDKLKDILLNNYKSKIDLARDMNCLNHNYLDSLLFFSINNEPFFEDIVIKTFKEYHD